MKNIFTFIYMLVVSATLQAQQFTDLDLMEQDSKKGVTSIQDTRTGNDVKPMNIKSGHILAKINPIYILLKGAMFVYQNVFSGQLASSCFYNMSCSNYAKHSIKYFGLLKGVIVSYDRLLRCSRIAAVDIHPLKINPENGFVQDVPRDYDLKQK